MSPKKIFISLLFLSLFALPVHAEMVKKSNFKAFKNAQAGSYSVAVLDNSTGKVLFSKRANDEKPVASITKIIGAYVFLEEKPNLSQKVCMEQKDEVAGGRLRLPVGSTMKAKDFLYSSLIGSANNSATALIRLSGLTKDKFIDKMNNLAKDAGAEDANFVDSSGISPDNEASAQDLALIGQKVFSKSKICQISARKKYTFSYNGGRGSKTVTHTSPIVNNKNSSFSIISAKTGYLPEVGNNLIVKLRSKKNKKNQIIIALMGAKTKNATTQDAIKLGKWAFKNYK